MSQPDRLDPETRPDVRVVAQATRPFTSILGHDAIVPADDTTEPDCFHDLNLDQAIAAIVSGRGEYNLVPFFRTPLDDPAAIRFRHDVFRDLQRGELRQQLEAFAEEMRQTRRYLNLARVQHFKYEKERWFLDAAQVYHRAANAFADALAGSELVSDGFLGLHAYLDQYVASESFAGLATDEHRVRSGLDAIRYSLRIKDTRITVGRYEGEPDYSDEVERTFERFRQGAVESHLVRVPDPGSMDHVEAQIVQIVARLNPDEFRALDMFCSKHAGFPDGPILRFEREAQFYLAYLAHMDSLKGTGASFCLPEIGECGDMSVEEAFDIALAGKLVERNEPIVRNSFSLRSPERIIVVSGPNQGGKTTFSRMFGQLNSLAALGLPVPASRASLGLPDRVFTHFERQEDISTLRGKLDDELFRIKEILEQATDKSVLVVNEIFASTTLDDAITLGTNVMRQVVELGCVALFVTFVDELATFGPQIVSMVATVDPNDPARRTFRIVRKPADGRAYALAIAEKYGLTYDQLRSRVAK